MQGEEREPDKWGARDVHKTICHTSFNLVLKRIMDPIVVNDFSLQNIFQLHLCNSRKAVMHSSLLQGNREVPQDSVCLMWIHTVCSSLSLMETWLELYSTIGCVISICVMFFIAKHNNKECCKKYGCYTKQKLT